jgi:Mg2+-importing ATPase
MRNPLDEAILACPSDAAAWRKIDEMPFDFERRRVSVLVEQEGERQLRVKGAPEDVLQLSGRYQMAAGEERPLDNETRDSFAATFASLGAQGYRALGIAIRHIDRAHDSAAVSHECELVFAGYAVFLDPPKVTAGTTIQALAASG